MDVHGLMKIKSLLSRVVLFGKVAQLGISRYRVQCVLVNFKCYRRLHIVSIGIESGSRTNENFVRHQTHIESFNLIGDEFYAKLGRVARIIFQNCRIHRRSCSTLYTVGARFNEIYVKRIAATWKYLKFQISREFKSFFRQYSLIVPFRS